MLPSHFLFANLKKVWFGKKNVYKEYFRRILWRETALSKLLYSLLKRDFLENKRVCSHTVDQFQKGLMWRKANSFKIRCEPLPPIGQKSDHGIVLLDTAHQLLNARSEKKDIPLEVDRYRKYQAAPERSQLMILERSYSVCRMFAGIIQVCRLIITGKACPNENVQHKTNISLHRG